MAAAMHALRMMCIAVLNDCLREGSSGLLLNILMPVLKIPGRKQLDGSGWIVL